MITFSPIQKLIQETLHQKMRMLEKTPKIGINEPSTEEGGVPQENYMFARSVFLRMTSLLTRNEKPIVLMGGELFEGQYRKGLDVYGQKSGGVNEENPNLRPLAGVKDVNVEYAGGGMRIGSTRKTSINWTCWTWEELQKFKPFFLTHGKAVLIEFGWGFQGADSPSMLPIIKENGDINLNLITGQAAAPLNEDQDRQTSLQEMIPEYILKQKGHYDAVLGTINNFEFSVNETGGFDCTTDLVSMGVNTMRKMDSKESVRGHISNLPILQPVESGMWWWKSKDFLKNQAQDKNPYYSFKSYMKSLEGHLHSNALNSKGSIAYILGGDAPYCTWGWFEDNVLSRFAGQINSENNKVVSEFRSLESVYDDEGNQVDVQPTLMRVSQDLLPIDYSPKGWFWVYPQQVSNRTDFWNDKSLDESNNKLIPGYKVGYTTTGRGRFAVSNSETIGDFKLMFAPPYLQQDKANKGDTGKYLGTGKPSISEKWKKTFLGNKNAKWNYTDSHFRPFKSDSYSSGVIRNIYFGHEFLTECFDAGTIQEGIESVWSKFSEAYGGIYDFGIEFDDREGRLMIKDKGFSDKKVHKVLENTSKKPADEVYDNKGVFVFPIWEKTSIVKNQNLSAKLPNRMQVAAMYGNNDPAFGDGVIEDMEDWGAVSLGRKNNETEDDENKRQKLFDSLLGSVEHPFRRLDGEQYTFGNASADNTKPLQWMVGKSSHTTNIYEDLTDENGSANDENDKFGQGINEVMEEDLKVEYNKRLLRAAGLEDEVEDTEKALKEAKIDKEKLETKKNEFQGATTEASKVGDIYNGSSFPPEVKVEQSPTNGSNITFCPKMKDEYQGIMRMSLKGDQNGILKTSDPLIPIELELEIDGTGGIFPGNSFHSSYLPQSYMDRMCFQIKGASHKIDSSGWTTTLVGQMRVAGKEKISYERVEDVPGFGLLKPEVFEELPEVKEIRKIEKKDDDLTRSLMGDLIGDLNEGTDIDPTPKPKPKIKPKKKKQVKKFKKKVKKMKETEEGSGVYRIGDNIDTNDDGGVIFVGKLGSDYDAGSRTVNTPSGRKNINDIQATSGGTYDATSGNTYQWDNSLLGGDFWNR